MPILQQAASHGMLDVTQPLTVIGTDGGLLAAPLQREYVMLAPAEHIDLWVDFSRWPAGTDLTLQSLAFDDGMAAMGGMMGGMMGGTALPDGAAFTVLDLRVDGSAKGVAAGGAAPPRSLSALPRAEPRLAINAGRPKVFELTMGMMTWGINGQGFDMLGTSDLETVRLGSHEVWEFRNDASTGMMGMVMAHAMHVHGLQFRVEQCKPGEVCAVPAVQRGYRVIFWVVAALVAVALGSPYVAPLFY